MKYFLIGLACLIGLIGLDWGLEALDIVKTGIFEPKRENVRRHIFENTQSYVQGKIQDLSNYKLQYDTTKDAGNKAAIKAVIRSQFANFDISTCPDELKGFLQECRGY